MTLFLGVDVSTTATKALLVDEDGTIVSVARSEYGFEVPRPMWAEQSPELWWTAAVEAIRAAVAHADIDPSQIAGIGLTGQMHGLVLLDSDGRVLRNAILWNDQRTARECDEIRHRVGRSHLIEVTGNDALTGFTAPKILWVRNNEPDVYAATKHVLLPKDFVRLRLTGDHATDKAGGSGTILFNLKDRDWSHEIVEALEIDPHWLPATYEGTHATGAVNAYASAATGIPVGVPVYAGGGDQAANAVGVGAVEPGILAMSVGTSGVVFGTTDTPAIEPEGRLHAFCHAIPDKWHLMGVMLSAAGSYRWLRDRIAPAMSFQELDGLAADVKPGSDGLIFLPYLTGERTPHPDPLARGAFVGLTTTHGLGHLARAVMEGVAFGLRESIDLLAGESPIAEIRASGGGAASNLWTQIIADAVGAPISVLGTSEGAAQGAALLAATGSSNFRNVGEATRNAVGISHTVEPSSNMPIVQERLATYRTLYPALAPSFAQLSGNRELGSEGADE